MSKRKQYSAALKTRMVLEVLKEEKTVAEVAAQYEVHPTMLHAWRREFLEKAPEVFEKRGKKTKEKDDGELTDVLYKQIGQLKVEVDFLKGACDKLNLRPGKDVSK